MNKLLFLIFPIIDKCIIDCKKLEPLFDINLTINGIILNYILISKSENYGKYNYIFIIGIFYVSGGTNKIQKLVQYVLQYLFHGISLFTILVYNVILYIQ